MPRTRRRLCPYRSGVWPCNKGVGSGQNDRDIRWKSKEDIPVPRERIVQLQIEEESANSAVATEVQRVAPKDIVELQRYLIRNRLII